MKPKQGKIFFKLIYLSISVLLVGLGVFGIVRNTYLLIHGRVVVGSVAGWQDYMSRSVSYSKPVVMFETQDGKKIVFRSLYTPLSESFYGVSQKTTSSTPVTIYYDPKNPQVAEIAQTVKIGGMITSVYFITLGLLIIMFEYKTKKKLMKDDYPPKI